MANPFAPAEEFNLLRKTYFAEGCIQPGAAVACGSVGPLFCSSTAGSMTNHHAAPVLFCQHFACLLFLSTLFIKLILKTFNFQSYLSLCWSFNYFFVFLETYCYYGANFYCNLPSNILKSKISNLSIISILHKSNTPLLHYLHFIEIALIVEIYFPATILIKYTPLESTCPEPPS